jgi:hypothetical protein
MTCTLTCGGKRYAGLVLDISANGLFVQTSAGLEPGEPLQIEVSLPGRQESLRMDGRTARRRAVPSQLRAVAQGGVGIALVNAPEEYFEYVAEVFRAPAAVGKPKPRRKSSLERQARQLALRRSLGPRMPRPPDPGDEAKPAEMKAAVAKPGGRGVRRYRVRVKLGLRRQTLEVAASSDEDARRRALADAGDGWRVLRCEECE